MRHPARLVLALAALPLLAESYSARARAPRARSCARAYRAPCPPIASVRDEDPTPRAVAAPNGAAAWLQENNTAPNGAAAWLQENVLAGVEPGVDTYTVMVVYFVQGVLGLSALARTFFLKDALSLSPAEVASLQARAQQGPRARPAASPPLAPPRRRSRSRRGSSSPSTASSPTASPSTATAASRTLSSPDSWARARGSR